MALRKEVGKVPLRVFSFRTGHIISGVLNGDYDLGIISEVIENPKLTVWPLFDDPHVTVLPEAHPLARRASVDIQSLADLIISWPRASAFETRSTARWCPVRSGDTPPKSRASGRCLSWSEPVSAPPCCR